jgi:long-chain acyl-CoA synthetase
VSHPQHPSQASIIETRREIESAVDGRTVCSEFLRRIGERPTEPALRCRRGDGWRTYSWAHYGERAGRVAAGLRRLGLARGELVAILCRNRPEFHFLDVGTLLAGGTPFSLYNSSPPEQIAFALGHSGASVLVVEDPGFLERVEQVRDRLPQLRHIVVIDPGDDSLDGGALSLASLTDGPGADLAEAAAQVRPEDPLTVIYTSGTTGAPKGVVLSHHNMCYAVEADSRASGLSMTGLRQLSYLPMAHIGERFVTHYLHILGGTFVTTCADLAQLPAMMVEVRPQWWFSAPRLWEKLRAGVEASLLGDPETRREFDEALELGRRAHLLSNEGRPLPAELDRAWAKARAEVVSPVLARIGLADVVLAITGAAPLAPETLRFFVSCGVNVSDVYGSSETSGFMAWSPNHIVPGTSGKPLPGLEMRIADDGEVLVRAPSVFHGYLRDPDRTREALTGDGWYHTGDIGRWDEAGNLSIIDRKKEILVPASGHKVSPVLLESAVKRECPLVGQACAIGDARPHISMIMVLDPDLAPAWAREQGLGTADLADLAGSPEMADQIGAAIARVNGELAPAERIRSWVVLANPWLPDTDLLTPTAKLKRRGVHARYAAEIEKMYSDTPK